DLRVLQFGQVTQAGVPQRAAPRVGRRENVRAAVVQAPVTGEETFPKGVRQLLPGAVEYSGQPDRVHLVEQAEQRAEAGQFQHERGQGRVGAVLREESAEGLDQCLGERWVRGVRRAVRPGRVPGAVALQEQVDEEA